MAITPDENPWQGFAHPDHRPEDFEPLFRHLRYTLIHLRKLWVAIQSCPVFLNSVTEHDSVSELEQILNWFQQAPNWHEALGHSKSIPELADPGSRVRLLEFITDLKSCRALLKKIQSKLSVEPTTAALRQGVALANQSALPDWKLSDLEIAIGEAGRRLGEIKRIQGFFETCAFKFDCPVPSDFSETESLLHAFEWIRQMPEKIRPWRMKAVTAPGQGIRIQAWQDRIRPLLEMRRKLNTKFFLKETMEVGLLNQISDGLRTSKWFYPFTRSYRIALKDYRRLRRPRASDQRLPREPRLEMIEAINEWILFLEQSQTFEKNVEVRQAFGPLFKGIDTDFQVALEAHLWSNRLREEFSCAPRFESKTSSRNHDRLGALLAEFVIRIPEAQILDIEGVMKSPELTGLQALLGDPDFVSGRKYSDLLSERQERLRSLTELRETLLGLGILPNVPFSALSELKTLSDDLIFLRKQVEKAVETSPFLKSVYAGMDTDLLPIERAVSYVVAIEASPIHAELKKSLLSPSGPQRLVDTQGQIPQCLFSLATVQNYLVRLEAMTYGQVRTLAGRKSIRSIPVPKLIDRIQCALDHSQDMDAWVVHLRAERESKRGTALHERSYGLAQNLESKSNAEETRLLES